MLHHQLMEKLVHSVLYEVAILFLKVRWALVMACTLVTLPYKPEITLLARYVELEFSYTDLFWVVS